MASIRRRKDRYQVQVRRKGFEPVSKTFTSRTAAKKWVQVTEAAMGAQNLCTSAVYHNSDKPSPRLAVPFLHDGAPVS